MAKQEIIIDTKVQGLQSVERLTKEIADLGKTSKKASRQIDSVRAGADRTTKSAKVSSEQMGDLAGQFSKMGAVSGPVGALGGMFDALSVTMSGPLGAAIGATTLGLGTLFAGFKISQAVIAKTHQALENIADRAEKAGRAMTDFERRVSTANTRLEKANERLGASFDDMAVRAQGGAKFAKAEAIVFEELAKALDTVTVGFAGSAQRFGSTAVLIADDLAIITKSFEMGTDAIGGFVIAMGAVIDVHNEVTPMAMIVARDLDTIGAAAAAASSQVNELADALAGAPEAVQQGLKGQAAVLKPRKRRGGGKRKSAAERRRESGLAMVEGLAVPDEPFDPVEAAAARGIGVGDTAQIQLNELEDLARAAADLNRELQGIDIGNTAIATTLTTATAPALQMVAQGMVNLTEATVQTMGAFAAGVGTLGEFGDSVLDMFSDLSAQIGSFFIKTGIGMAFISPATGAGLIAAGLSLQYLSGALGAKGSGNAGGGKTSGGGGTGSSSAVTREIQRSLRGPDRGGQTTNIEVVIAGRAIEPEMVSIVDDMVRLRRSRTLGRMGA